MSVGENRRSVQEIIRQCRRAKRVRRHIGSIAYKTKIRINEVEC